MQRDFDLILKILEYFEQREERNETSAVKELEVEAYDQPLIEHHLKLMYQYGLLDAETVLDSTTPEASLQNVFPLSLSWEGHAFYDLVRHKQIADKVKQSIGASRAEASYEFIKALAVGFEQEIFGKRVSPFKF